MENKVKNSAVDLTELAIGIVVLGIVVSIGAVILTNVANTQITNAGTYSIVNESVSATTSGTNLAVGWGNSLTKIYNATNSVVVNNANATFTVNPTTGLATISNSTCVGAADLCKGNWLVTYSVYNKSDPRYALPTNATTGLAEYGNWFKILVIVGIAAVVLALIFMAFGKGSSGESSEGGISY